MIRNVKAQMLRLKRKLNRMTDEELIEFSAKLDAKDQKIARIIPAIGIIVAIALIITSIAQFI